MKNYLQKYYKFKKTKPTNVRISTPFEIICTFCNAIIPKGKRHNSFKEKCGEYMGIDIFRFYIRCIKCFSEVTIKTDIQNGTFVCESGCREVNSSKKKSCDLKNYNEKLTKNFDKTINISPNDHLNESEESDLENIKKNVEKFMNADKLNRRH
ncbi:Pre-mRNA-splicing factor cwf16 [Dictyocoela muelleri]|nr:Pre-mRNA-splicing factor cwf16 [Dictyocoela muelleri]